jgi:hypothetical protein
MLADFPSKYKNKNQILKMSNVLTNSKKNISIEILAGGKYRLRKISGKLPKGQNGENHET